MPRKPAASKAKNVERSAAARARYLAAPRDPKTGRLLPRTPNPAIEPPAPPAPPAPTGGPDPSGGPFPGRGRRLWRHASRSKSP